MNLQPNPKFPADACILNRNIEEDGRVVAELDCLVRPLSFDAEKGYLFQRLDNQKTFYVSREGIKCDEVVSLSERICDSLDFACFMEVDDIVREPRCLDDIRAFTVDGQTLSDKELLIGVLELYIERIRSSSSADDLCKWVWKNHGAEMPKEFLLKDWKNDERFA